MSTVYEQLKAMGSLVEDWDGYGAAAPHADVLVLAREFTQLLEAVLARTKAPPSALDVSPTRVGGILIEWEDDLAQHEVQFDPDRSISFLHLQKATGQIVNRRIVPAAHAAVDPALLQELRQLLAA